MIERPGVATILDELRRELKRQGLRAGALAAKLDVAEPTVRRWLRGEGLTLARLDQICAITGLDLRDLISRSYGDEPDTFTLAQERTLAADRGLALTFFAILHGARRQDLEQDFGLTGERLERYLERLSRLDLVDVAPNGRLRARTRRTVLWRRGGPLSGTFEKTVKQYFLGMNFGSDDARYVFDMVRVSEAGRARIMAMFEALREDIHLVVEQDQSARMEAYDWTGLLMLVHPLDIIAATREWRTDQLERSGEDSRSKNASD